MADIVREITFDPSVEQISLGQAKAVRLVARLDPTGVAALNTLYRMVPEKANDALMTALNAAAIYGRKLILRAITSRLNVRRKDIAGGHSPKYGGVRLTRATRLKLLASVDVTRATEQSSGETSWKSAAGRLPLIRFVRGAATHTGPPGPPPRYAITPGMHKSVPHSFIATMKSGHRGVFIRARYLSAWGVLSGASVKTAQGAGAHSVFHTPQHEGIMFVERGRGAMGEMEWRTWKMAHYIRRGTGRRVGSEAGVWSWKPGQFTAREPIYELFGPSLTRVVERDQQLARAWVVDVSDRLNRRLVSQLSRFTGTSKVQAQSLMELEGAGDEGGENG